jgi:hypothetical protein
MEAIMAKIIIMRDKQMMYRCISSWTDGKTE